MGRAEAGVVPPDPQIFFLPWGQLPCFFASSQHPELGLVQGKSELISHSWSLGVSAPGA